MIVAETKVFPVGPYSVQQKPRFDNPAFAVYIVSRRGKFIGKSFSFPDLGCCQWLEREAVYATASQTSTALYDARMKAGAKGRATPGFRRGRQRKEAAELELAEAISS